MAVEVLSWNDPGTRERWTALDRSSVLASPQTSSEYLSALSEATGLDLEATFVVTDGVDVAGLSILVTNVGPFRRILPSPLTSFCALNALSLPTEAQIHANSSWLDELFEVTGKRNSTVDLMLPPAIQDVRAAQWRGWSTSPLYTYTLPLDESGELVWSEGTRRTFNKHRSSFILRSDKNDASSVLELWRGGYERNTRTPPLNSTTVASMTGSLLDDGIAECWSVSSDSGGAPDAGIILLTGRETAVYWLAGSKPGPAMTVLIGLLSGPLRAAGMMRMDFVGANTRNIAEFKRRFNPELETYYRVRYTRNRILRLIQSVIQSIR